MHLQSLIFPSSHPGYFGKRGMRHFHLKRNQYFSPSINVDKLWSLVSEQTRLNSEKNKEKAAVIDVTKAVNYIIYLNLNRATSKFLARVNSPRSQLSSRLSSSPRLLKRESRKQVVSASSALEMSYIHKHDHQRKLSEQLFDSVMQN